MKNRLLITIGLITILIILMGVVLWPEYGMVCNNAVVEHLQKYSNVFDESIVYDTYGIEDIGLPFGVHSVNLQECVNLVLEKRIELQSNFTLTVSNQSSDIDPVDILVKIDGKTVVDNEFLVKQQHNYQYFYFILEPGVHILYAESIKGKYQLQEEFTIKKELWASLDFQYYEGDETLPKLRLIISETELGFM